MTASPSPPALETASLEWTSEGDPVSARYGDVYFSRDNGLEESRYVFLQQNHLAQRWQTLGALDTFVIAETGFGTGLNFLAAWQLWEQQATAGARLHYVSFELYPLDREDLARALGRWSTLARFREALLAQYPPPIAGWHRLVFDEGRVRLSLYLGDANEGLECLAFTANAWFLDGFAPKHNPELWQEALLDKLGQRSARNATFATFTAVGAVRRQLQATNFKVEKRRGFGSKRDMLAGQFAGTPHSTPAMPPAPVQWSGTRPSVAIIGAGIAGCLTARNLANRGFDVHLIDKAEKPGSGASGNAQGALYHRLGVEWKQPETQLAVSGLLFSQRYFSELQANLPKTSRFWFPCGLLHLAFSKPERSRLEKFLSKNTYPGTFLRPVSAAEASALSGIRCDHGGLYFPGLGWLRPNLLCQVLADHPRILFHGNRRIDALKRLHTGWHLQSKGNATFSTDTVVLCNADKVGLLAKMPEAFPLKAIRGQVSRFKPNAVLSPSVVLCGDGYINPALDHLTLIGATFDLNDTASDPRDGDDKANLRKLNEWLPASVVDGNAIAEDRRVGFRAASPDYQPLMGPVPAPHYGADTTAPALAADRKRYLATEATEYQSGLYCLTGLGSKGLSMAPLLAETLSDIICGNPPALEDKLIAKVHSVRFLRSAKRN
ncbi:bifunctional tRNA (5-methylaminomethyl-2-thiouridine)(34)-methyltransferase MnmD/FAD-dependent 5-carboxymethylaminomethyl-2-thiouridine(34) oxidoreductase MnmC [Marinobacteraceae bacterium S3BR75-40.1]